MTEKECILVTGAAGQLGTELTEALVEKYDAASVVATDINIPAAKGGAIWEKLNVLDREGMNSLVTKYQVTQIYHLAAILSAKGEQNPQNAWQLNMDSLLNVLEIAVKNKVKKVFWPSSIAVFGATTPSENAPQDTLMSPRTVYGISKLAGELWCKYYFENYGLDVRSIRYPGLVSHKAKPGGGTTDYAVDIFHQALANNFYSCFLKPDTRLPMLYMPDAIRGTLSLMDAPSAAITVRTSYNLAGLSFTPEALAAEIKQHLPGFQIVYQPDFRQQIADSWPGSIDDSIARRDWGWQPAFKLQDIAAHMLKNIGQSMKLQAFQ